METTRKLVLFGAMLLMALGSGGVPAPGAEIAGLRQHSLDLVNSSRAEAGLPPLQLDRTLNRSAEGHAEDMLERDYFAHVSPDGEDVLDRYLAAGGSRWRLVSENIGQCTNCAPPVTESHIERQHENWMQSPEHRANILGQGLDSYGLGLAAAAGELYAVQNFSGPGTPRGLAADETARSLARDEIAALAVELVNERRAAQGVAPLRAADALVDAARDLVPDDLDLAALEETSLRDALPPSSREQWQRLRVVSGSCGGCGVEPTDADVSHFIAEWFDEPQYRETLLEPGLEQLGFALRANGEGRKTGLALLAGP